MTRLLAAVTPAGLRVYGARLKPSRGEFVEPEGLNQAASAPVLILHHILTADHR